MYVMCGGGCKDVYGWDVVCAVHVGGGGRGGCKDVYGLNVVCDVVGSGMHAPSSICSGWVGVWGG